MLPTGELGIDDRVGADLAQGGDELPGGGDRDDRVPVAVRDEDRWCRRPGVRGRSRAGSAAVRTVEAVEEDRGGDGGVDLGETGLEPRIVRGECGQRGQVAAGRAAG